MNNLRVRRFITLASCVALAASHFFNGFAGRSRGLGLVGGSTYLVAPAQTPATALARSVSRHQ